MNLYSFPIFYQAPKLIYFIQTGGINPLNSMRLSVFTRNLVYFYMLFPHGFFVDLFFKFAFKFDFFLVFQYQRDFVPAHSPEGQRSVPCIPLLFSGSSSFRRPL